MFNNELESSVLQLAPSSCLTLTGLSGKHRRESGWWERNLGDKGKRMLGDKESIECGR